MKLIHSKAELLQQPSGLEGVYKAIELAGRTCYRSQDKITEDSAKDFVDRMIKSKHTAMLEHGTVYMFIPIHCDKDSYRLSEKYYRNPYSKVNIRRESYLIVHNGYYITTNYRVIVENGWEDDLRFIYEPTEHHEKRYTVRFTTDQGILRELTRHRVFSYAVESTRYCNYSKDKYGNELTFIIPSWMGIDEQSIDTTKGFGATEDLIICMGKAERAYMYMLEQGLSPQQARQILPLATKCDVVMTGFASDWRYFFDLRLFGKTGNPHPDMVELTEKLQKEMIEAGIWEDIMKYSSKFE